jgi:Flp pilus assembly pilin Flp
MAPASKRLRSRAGQSLPEYAILLALVATGLLILLLGFRGNVGTIYTATNNALAAIASGITGAGGGGTASPTGGGAGDGSGAGSISGGGDGGPAASVGGSTDGGAGSSSGGTGGSEEDPSLTPPSPNGGDPRP